MLRARPRIKVLTAHYNQLRAFEKGVGLYLVYLHTLTVFFITVVAFCHYMFHLNAYKNLNMQHVILPTWKKEKYKKKVINCNPCPAPTPLLDGRGNG